MRVSQFLEHFEKLGMLEEARDAVKRAATQLGEPHEVDGEWVFEDRGIGAWRKSPSLAHALAHRESVIVDRAKMLLV
jgi:hypothetical protein